MTGTEHLQESNLEELRRQLTGQVALAVMASGGLSIWLGLQVWTAMSALLLRRIAPFPVVPLLLFAAMLAIGWEARRLSHPHPQLARHLLVWGLAIALVASMALLSDP